MKRQNKKSKGEMRPTIAQTDIVFGFDEMREDDVICGLSHTADGVAFGIWPEEDGSWRWSVEYQGTRLERLLGERCPDGWGDICWPWPLSDMEAGARCDSALAAYLDMTKCVSQSSWWQALPTTREGIGELG